MPGTGSAGLGTRVKPPRLSSPSKLRKTSEDEVPPPKSKASSRIGSAVSVASTSRMSEKDAAGLITDLTRLKEITHDVRIPKQELPHRRAIDIDQEEEFMLDGQFPLPEDEEFDIIQRWQESDEREDDEESDVDDDIEEVFGEDVISVSSLGSNPDDDAAKYDTDLEEDVESKYLK